MILLDIKNYLKQARSAPVRDIALHFKLTEDDARSMLDHWVRKGQAIKQPIGTLCQGGCNSCAPNTIEIYQWLEADA
ncbi:MAG: FeoC-like transcriptional regulator [Cycloclasticus sp.]|nr:FeoC-like transcriptional regulator [Cycloclasticus sp.]